MLRTWEGCKHLHIRDSEWAPGFKPIWGNEPVNGGPLYLCLIIKKQKCSNTSLPLQKELQHFIWPFDSFRTKDGMSISLQSRLPYVDTGIRTHHKIECVKTGLVRAASDKITQWPSGCVIRSNEQGLCLSCMDFFFPSGLCTLPPWFTTDLIINILSLKMRSGLLIRWKVMKGDQ